MRQFWCFNTLDESTVPIYTNNLSYSDRLVDSDDYISYGNNSEGSHNNDVTTSSSKCIMMETICPLK